MGTKREAAKRLCQELERVGLTPLPHRGGKVVAKKDHREQAVVLRPTSSSGDGDHYWFWVWETEGEPLVDRGVRLGEEAELARRISRVMSIPDLGGVTL